MNLSKNIRVLVVDDESSLRKVLSQLLDREGYEVSEASSGEEAWELFVKTPFPLVIVDIVMQGMTGIELLQKIKTVRPDTQVIVMTSYASLDTAVTALRSGAYDYLFKPFEDLEIILAATRRAAEKIQLITRNQLLIDRLQSKSDNLEQQVQERTAELTAANQKLTSEIEQRIQTQNALEMAKQAAETSNRAKSDFLSNMSHELRTPLNHIIGFTEILLDHNDDKQNTKQIEYLKNVLGSARHLLSLVNDILTLTHMETGRLKLNREEISLCAVLESSVSMLAKQAFKHKIKINTLFDNTPKTITADGSKLKQILYNLISNAVKFTPDGGHIEVKAKEVNCRIRSGLRKDDKDYLKVISKDEAAAGDSSSSATSCVEVSVQDSGIGLKPADLSRVFNRFEQLDSSRSRKFAGTGVGLSLTKALVELHGGRIWAESDGEGRGSTFRFIIPG